MSHHCPQCKTALACSAMRSEFACQNCQQPLRSNRIALLWTWGLIAIIAETLIFFGLSKAFGNYAEGALAWTFVGGLAAFIIYWVVEEFLVSVKVALK